MGGRPAQDHRAIEKSSEVFRTVAALALSHISERFIYIYIFPFAQVTASVNESIPAYPMMFGNGSVTDLSSAANSVGIMRNGVALFRHVKCVS